MGTTLLVLATATVTVAYYEVHKLALHGLMACGLVWLLVQWGRGHPLGLGRTGRILIAVLLIYALVAVLSAVRVGLNAAALERLEHFVYFAAGALAFPFVLALRSRPVWLWVAVALAATLSGLYALWEMQRLAGAFEQIHGIAYRAGGSKGKQIPFGDIAILTAMLSALGASVFAPSRRLWSVLLLFAAGWGVYASLASGTRGAWLFLPTGLVVITVFIARHSTIRRRYLWAGLVAVLLCAALGFSESDHLRGRWDRAVSELQSYQQGSTVLEGNALGERLEMWRGAWMAYQEHPWLGIGVGQLNDYFKNGVRKGVIAPAIGQFNGGEGHTHAHSDYIHALATRGRLGLASLLLLYLIPLAVFVRTAVLGARAERRALGYAGILTVLSFMEFSLTDSVLLMRMTSGYFVLLSIWLLALCLDAWEPVRA